MLTELEEKAVLPGFWDDGNKARAVIEQTNQQRSVLKPFNDLHGIIEECDLLVERVRKSLDSLADELTREGALD